MALSTAGLIVYASATSDSGYLHYMLAMTVVGAGIGLAMAPATQAIMGALPPAKAGVGSAINDTTRNLGGVLGIAVIGSLVTSAYQAGLASTRIPARLAESARRSVGAATQIAHRLPDPIGHDLAAVARHAFVHAVDGGLLVAAGLTLAAMVIAVRALPGPAPAAGGPAVGHNAPTRA